LIAIGNELLIGQVHDTNLHWLCRRLNGLGAFVRQAYIVRDDPAAIGEVIRLALSHRPALVITTGGLGPTWDDITLSAIGEALGRKVRLDERALEIVRERYRQVKAAGLIDDDSITPEREKMAYLPEGSTPLWNPVGTAPGVLMDVNGTHIVALPGVPPEMRGIFDSSLQPYLHEWFSGLRPYQWGIMLGQGESTVAHIINSVAESHPKVYVKSRARTVDGRPKVLITLTVSGMEKGEALKALRDARNDLLDRLRTAKAVILEEGEDLPFQQEN
jgi:molybdenum cofactor synthesis domain-containing protein